MFDEVTFAEFAPTIAIIVFIIALSVFLFILARVIRMPKTKVETMAKMPFEPEVKDTQS